MKVGRIEITGNNSRESWAKKQVNAGVQKYEEVMTEGMMEIIRDLAEVINRQALQDLPMIVASMHIMENAIRKPPIWIDENDEIVKLYEARFRTGRSEKITTIPKNLEEEIEKWKRRKEEQT